MRGYHGAFSTVLACQQGTFTIPDTWFRLSFLGLACAPIVETIFLDISRDLIYLPREIGLIEGNKNDANFGNGIL